LLCGEQKSRIRRVKYWEIIADNLKKAGWSLGYVSAIDSNERTIWIADAHCGDGKRFVLRADEKLTAFLELQRVTRESFRFPNAEWLDTILAMPFHGFPLATAPPTRVHQAACVREQWPKGGQGQRAEGLRAF
jgi:hypothetical protein